MNANGKNTLNSEILSVFPYNIPNAQTEFFLNDIWLILNKSTGINFGEAGKVMLT